MFDIPVILSGMDQAAGTSVGYCRKCFYDLRGIGSASKCPECGRPFDLSDPKTFRTRRPRGMWRRLRWVVYPLLLIVLACAGGIGWLCWGWHREQAGIAWVRLHNVPINYEQLASLSAKSMDSPWLHQRMGRWGFLMERADYTGVITIDRSESAEQSPLWRLDHLTHIDLRGPGVTDEWVAMLCRRLRPKTLYLIRTSLTDAGLAPVSGVQELEGLLLEGSNIRDEGLAHLNNLPELRSLRLEYAEVRGSGLTQLSSMPKLEWLRFFCTPIDDSAIEHLAKLKTLKILDIDGSKITPDGLVKLRTALPNCQIDPP